MNRYNFWTNNGSGKGYIKYVSHFISVDDEDEDEDKNQKER